ncbi:Mitogen-activated protein kinase kinase kinase YODA [Hibiscus syriacus]|uniref:mitogen-activated protein kinase kinase kinase n=1 Tax=Hibiscus syriacus TaxID=106335 RepID=A0A6A2WQK0_HIBSY|nr:mitogen-activated protein kinase kinase kinase 5-like isoform X2 [Hibiscus syriacus]KAE8662858.1 Mitogen-activated protein kinase kinase kinase YODA [Hibiscus syriacus]
MRWLRSISFSSFSSTSSSSSSATSPKKPCKDNDNNSNKHRFSFGFRLSRLTRAKELRRVRDQGVAPTKEVQVPVQPSCYHTPSFSPSSSARISTPAVAVPLPLPLPAPEGDCEQRLSPKDAGSGKGLEGRDKEKEAEPRLSANSRFASRRSSKRADCARRSSEKILYQELIRGDSFEDDFRANDPISSAPGSPLSRAVISPTGKNPSHRFLHFMTPAGGNHAWSAPEMPTLDVPGHFPLGYYDYGAYSIDYTPFHTPPNRSPRQRQRSGPPSPIKQRISLDSSPSRSSNVHPLPRPPGAAMTSTSASIPPQVTSNPDPLRMNCQWKKGKLIGRGTFGSVYVASNRQTGALCAMKEVEIFPDDPKSAECIKQLEQEIKVLSQLRHPNIVQYYGSEIVEDKFYIYLEYVHPGSINKYVRDHYGAITESVVRNFTRHILSGLAYLHGTKTIHRDIKGANLLVDAFGVVKLADFGMSKHLSGQRANLSLKGSPYWMAPELLQAVMQNNNCSSELALAVDIWSLGCTIIEMYTGKAPWSEYEGAAAMFKVMRDTPPTPKTLSPEGKDFLRCCFQRNPAERPSASMLLEHQFIKGSNGLTRDRSELNLNQFPVQQGPQRNKTDF